MQLLAKKVYTLYSLAVQQLSKQDHYDFGLRALVSVLRYAGRKKRANPTMADEEVSVRARRVSACVASVCASYQCAPSYVAISTTHQTTDVIAGCCLISPLYKRGFCLSSHDVLVCCSCCCWR